MYRKWRNFSKNLSFEIKYEWRLQNNVINFSINMLTRRKCNTTFLSTEEAQCPAASATTCYLLPTATYYLLPTTCSVDRKHCRSAESYSSCYKRFLLHRTNVNVSCYSGLDILSMWILNYNKVLHEIQKLACTMMY